MKANTPALKTSEEKTGDCCICSKRKTLTRWFLAVLLVMSCGKVSAQSTTLLRYVDPFIGTAKSNVPTKWGGNGGTYPGAVAPSGLIQLSPDTRIDGAKGYDYADSVICHFSCLNHFSGFPDGSSGRLFVMPVVATEKFEPGRYARRFSHRSETATPGYYKVVLTDNQTIVEATASQRAGIFRFTFPAGVTPQLFISDAGLISSLSGRVLHGSSFHSVFNLSESFTGKKEVGGGCLLSFAPARDNKVIELRISTSSVSFAGARHNLDVESGHSGFDEIRDRTAGDWIKRLEIIQVDDESEKNKAIFYTALYHANLVPWVISDVDGRYKGTDGLIHHTSGSNQYGGFSPWDTFRSLHPLLSLLYSGRQNDIIRSMLDIFKQSGHLPTESMTGNHAVPIIVDAYLKGVNGFDQALAYTAMKKSLVDPPFIQNDMDVYHRLGYVPLSKPESVTRTVEYAYDDWALAQYARSYDHQDYKRLIQRSYNYSNLFDPGQLFLLPRQGKRFNLEPGMSGYKEGDKWVYSYFVPQDPNGLINLMGGPAAFADRLDSALTHGTIVFDNETVLHLPYLFNAAGLPSLTQKWCSEIMNGRYTDSPGGLPGNDDLGAMSSWYVFSALGIFPSCPGRPLYSIGLPLFKTVTLHLPNGKRLTIRCHNQGQAYVHSLQVNGKPYGQTFIRHATLLKGATLDFSMGASADNQWAEGSKPGILSETKTPARIQFAGYTLSTGKVAPHELFWVRFKLKNSGSTGTKKVVLSVNGAVYAQKNCLVEGGGIVTDSISCRLYAPGEATLSLNDTGISKVTVVLSGPVMHPFEITGLTAKSMVRRDDRQVLSYAIQNTGGLKCLFKVPLIMNGALARTDTLSLEPGEKRTINDTLLADSLGFDTLTVGTQKTVYKVYSHSQESLLLDLSFSSMRDDSLLADRSGFGNDGHVRGIRAKTGVGDNRTALLGNDRYVEVLNSGSLDRMHESITMMAWVYPTAAKPGLVDLLSKGDFSVIQVADTKTLTFFAGGWSRGDCTVPLPVNWLGHWHHLAGACRQDSLFLYVDGTLSGTAKLETTVNLSTTSRWNVGRNEEFPSERIFAGYIDQVKIFEQDLSVEDIRMIVNTEKNTFKYLPKE